MRALFFKECRQGWLLPVFGLALAGVIPVLYLLLLVSRIGEPRDLDAYCGYAYLLLPFLIALFAGSGLVAGEVERGTLPALLALPLSRRRVFLAKVLAGFFLAVVSAALPTLSGLVLLPSSFAEVEYGLYLPDLGIWFLVTFWLAVFWSVLCRRVISALLATLVGMVACFTAALAVTDVFGGSLLGYDPLLDAGLWALCLVPGLCAASYWGFSRGGLLQSGAKWRLALPVLALTVAVVGLFVVGLTRSAFRYDRARVSRIGWAKLSADGSVLCLATEGNPVPLQRRSAEGWSKRTDNLFRGRYLVFADAGSGRELVVLRGFGDVAISGNGGKAALVPEAPLPALTWRERAPEDRRLIETWDLARRRRLYRGLPREAWDKCVPPFWGVEWSPDGSWVSVLTERRHPRMASAITALGQPLGGDVLLVMKPDGREARCVDIWRPSGAFQGRRHAWGQGRSRGAIFTLERDGRVLRHDLSSRRVETIWNGPETSDVPGEYVWEGGDISVSPEGRLISVILIGAPAPQLPGGFSSPPAGSAMAGWSHFVFILATDGSRHLLIHQGKETTEWISQSRHLGWSPDGRSLYLEIHWPQESLPRRHRGRVAQVRVFRWREGEARAAPYEFPPGSQPPGPGDRLLKSPYGDTWLVDEKGELRPFPFERVISLAAGVIRYPGYNLLGLELDGRAILQETAPFTGRIIAVDLARGKVEKVYP
jgi:hypothetical protein